jgi:hypothetical protein
LHLSRDGGESWSEITPERIPEWGTVNTIELSPHAPGKAYLAVHRYRLDDFRPYVFRTEDHGQSWAQLAGPQSGIPQDHFVRVVREDPEREGLLYAGTEFGVYLSFDDGASWRPFQLNLPVTPVTDLAVRHGDLVVATQGRSFWVLEDLSPLHQMGPDVAEKGLHLFDPRPAVLFGPYGASLTYRLDRALDGDGEGEPAEELTLEILDADGEVLRRWSHVDPEYRAPDPYSEMRDEPPKPRVLPAERGLNRWTWNLRLQDPRVTDGTSLWGVARAPRVPPGRYTARLRLGDAVEEASLEVRQDPRSEVPRAALLERFDLARDVSRALGKAHETIRRLRSLEAQADAWERRLDETRASERARPLLERLRERLGALETRLTQPKASALQDILNYPPGLDAQLLFLQGVIEGHAGAPTEGARKRFAALLGELDGAREDLAAVVGDEVSALNALIDEAGLPPIGDASPEGAELR